MDSSGRIYAPEEVRRLERLSKKPDASRERALLKDLEPLTREEAARLADIPAHKRKAALAAMRDPEVSDE